MATKVCEVCGKEFIDYGRGKYCNNPHYKNCVVCGKLFSYDVRAQKIRETCSRSCASKLARKNIMFKPKVCVKCGETYEPTGSTQIFCQKCKETYGF